MPLNFPDTPIPPRDLLAPGRAREPARRRAEGPDECHRLLPAVPSDHLWLPYLGGTLDSGIATCLPSN